MRNYWILLFPVLIFKQLSAQADEHKLFTTILNKYASNGLVNYKDLKNDKDLEKYLEVLSNINPEEFNDDNSELAFWINAYNAFTLKVIVDNYPLESINDLHFGGLIIGSILGKTIWDDDLFLINGNKYSLNDIEHDIIRKKFNEPRIHFAVVCASISCPPLLNEAYEGYKIDEQLENQAIAFFNDETKNRFDSNKRIAEISKIMSWYESDFGDSDSDVLLYISKFINKEIAEDILNKLDDWEVDHLSYDWGLNEIK